MYTREYVHRKEIGQAKLSTCHIVLKIVCLTHLAIKIGNNKLWIKNCQFGEWSFCPSTYSFELKVHWFWKSFDQFSFQKIRNKYYPLYFVVVCMYYIVFRWHFTFRTTIAWDLTRSITNKSKGAKSGQLLSKNYFCHTSCYRTISCVVIKTGH